MQKATVMKGSGLKSLEDEKAAEVTHVFGKNLEERVVTSDEQEESPSISSFNVVTKTKSPEDDDIDSIRKRKFDAITGEEDEETIFQGDFKLFVWDLPTSNWIEKGRGQLKLNDSIHGMQDRKSRIIMRVSGTLRIILNVAVNRSYFKVIANSKTNIRFTDSQTVWAASGSNAKQLRDLIEERLKISAEEEEEESEIKKRSKSDSEDGLETTSKKTKPDDDDDDEEQEEEEEDEEREDEEQGEDEEEERGTKPSPAKTSENESNETDKSDATSPKQSPPTHYHLEGAKKNEVAASDERIEETSKQEDSKSSPKREDKNTSTTITKPAEDGGDQKSDEQDRTTTTTTTAAATTTIVNGEKS